ENAGERGEQNEEWKHRHQRGERDVACDRPAVVGEETPIGIEGDIESSSHRSVQPLPFVTILNSARVIPSGQCHSKWSTMQQRLCKSRQATRTCLGGVAFVHCTRSLGGRSLQA